MVNKFEETVKFYQEAFGIGSFEIFEVKYTDATYYGEKAGYRGKRAFARMGPMMIELIELTEGKTIHEQLLKERGEGLHHLGFEVPDLRESPARAQRLGFRVTQSWQLLLDLQSFFLEIANNPWMKRYGRTPPGLRLQG